MSKYIPFLKAKQNEIKSISELSEEVREAICPFFDFPKKMDGYEEDEFVAASERILKRLQKNVGNSFPFYFDNYDLEEGLEVGGEHNYSHLLQLLAGMNVIPVVGLDRSAEHNNAVLDSKQAGTLKSDVVAFRVCPEDFESFGVSKDDIESNLSHIFDQFDAIDLILDCRVCTNLKAATIAPQIQDFSQKFCANYSVRRVVVTGSSIPASIGDILKVKTEQLITRKELAIYSAVKSKHKHAPLIVGDYTTVSPNYSDVNIPPEMLQNIMTAKLTYTAPGAHYFIRGGAMKTNTAKQYFGMAKRLCSQSFFRGKNYSSGDAYLEEKSRGQGSNCSPNAVIKPAVVAHISYMVLNANI
jgi:hypothetical protein